jgi:putative membrane protein
MLMYLIVRGAVGGLIATGPMTLVMEGLHRNLPAHQRHSLPPKQITVRALGRVGLHHHVDEEEERTALTLVAHFGYGAAMGSLYAPAAHAVGAPGIASGIIFGLIVWLVSYLGVLPVLGLFPPAHKGESRQRNALMIAAHIVWGAALGSLVSGEQQRE